MKVLFALVLMAAACCFMTASTAGAQKIFRYCMIGTPNMGMDCTFDTLEQCRVVASAGVGFCQQNPAYTAQARETMPWTQRR